MCQQSCYGKDIDRLVKPGEPSRFIDKPVQHYALRPLLEQTAVRDQDMDRQVAEDWFAVDHEAWQQLDGSKPGATKPATRGCEIHLTALDRRQAVRSKRLGRRS